MQEISREDKNKPRNIIRRFIDYILDMYSSNPEFAYEEYIPTAEILNYQTTFIDKKSSLDLLNNIRAKRVLLESYVNLFGTGFAQHLTEIKVQQEKIGDKERDSGYFDECTEIEREVMG